MIDYKKWASGIILWALTILWMYCLVYAFIDAYLKNGWRGVFWSVVILGLFFIADLFYFNSIKVWWRKILKR